MVPCTWALCAVASSLTLQHAIAISSTAIAVTLVTCACAACQNVLFARPREHMHNVNPIFYAAVRRTTDKRKKAIPLTGVVAVAAAIRMCSSVDVYGMSTMTHAKACFYYWQCHGTDKWYHSRPGDAAFHDFRGNALALTRWNASGLIRIRV